MKPVILVAFANDINNPLLSLYAEQAGIKKQLSPLVVADLCELVIIEQADTQQILDAFNAYKNRIAVFHFAGHAEAYTLQLENAKGETESANARGFAEFLKHQSGLQLVFLNACSTAMQVEDLIEAQVSAVIATSRKIDEGVATFFSINFYQALGIGSTISKAFLEASAAVKMRYGDPENPQKNQYWSDEQHDDILPWKIFYAKGGEIAKSFSIPSAAGNPLFGLPQINDIELPQTPFKYFKYFNSGDASIFFGRSFEIRQLYDAITDEQRSKIIHLYGRSGVGKSSLLAAGVVPRIELTQSIRYIRVRKDESIATSISSTLNCQSNFEEIYKKWRSIEKTQKKPLTLVLDQFENILYESEKIRAGKYSDLDDLISTHRKLGPSIKGKLILSYRKEYLAEIENRFYHNRVDYEKVFLDELNLQGIKDAITGIEQNPVIKKHYRIEIEKGLSDKISNDLMREKNYMIAPILQILLSKMWRSVSSDQIRHFSIKLYEQLRNQGLLLSDFLDQRIRRIESVNASFVESGLTLDLLHFHCTSHGSAEIKTMSQIREAYSHTDFQIQEVLDLLAKEYLLVKTSNENPSYQLAHDILVPVVLEKYRNCRLPAQRANRILKYHLSEKYENDSNLLSPADLDVILQGSNAMRNPGPQADTLIENSKRAIRKSRNKYRLQISGIALLTISVIALFFINQQTSLDRARAEITAMETQAKIAEQSMTLRSMEATNLRLRNVTDSLAINAQRSENRSQQFQENISQLSSALDVTSQIVNIQRKITEAVQNDLSGSLFIKSGDRFIIRQGFGLAQLDPSHSFDTETLFDIPLLARQMTAVLCLQLIREGKLVPSSTVGSFISGVDDEVQSITLAELLSNTSGLPEYLSNHDEFRTIDKERFISRITRIEPIAKKGLVRSNRHTDYIILASIIDEVTEEGFVSSINRLMRDAEMLRTGFRGHRDWIDNNVASGIGRRQADKVVTSWPVASWSILGAGGILSCLEDVMKWQDYVDNQGYIRDLVAYNTLRISTDHSYAEQVESGMNGQFGIFRYYPERQIKLFMFNNCYDENTSVFVELVNAIEQDLF